MYQALLFFVSSSRSIFILNDNTDDRIIKPQPNYDSYFVCDNTFDCKFEQYYPSRAKENNYNSKNKKKNFFFTYIDR